MLPKNLIAPHPYRFTRDRVGARLPQPTVCRARRRRSTRGLSLSHSHTGARITHLIYHSNSFSTSNVGLNFSPTSAATEFMNGPCEFQNLQLGHGPKPKTSQILAIPHKLTLAQLIIKFPEHCFIYRYVVETVKLNFHLKLHITLDCNLDSGLCLELQVFCALASYKA